MSCTEGDTRASAAVKVAVMSEEVQSDRAIRGGIAIPATAPDQTVARFAAIQAGRVSRHQLLSAGVSPDWIDRQVTSRRLIIVQRGVYAVGFAGKGVREDWAAALLHAGPGSLLSHLVAAAGFEIRLPPPAVVDVTTTRRLAAVPGMRFHRREIHPAERRVLDGFPLTSPSQTLFDLATMLGTKALVAAANEALVRRLITVEDLHATLERNRGRKGSSGFRRMLARIDPEGRVIRSPLEARLNAFLRDRGFPSWESNARIRVGGEVIEPDVLWRRQRIVVEADGRDPHLAPLTFASDRRRDRRLRVEGWEPVRVTTVDLGDRPDELDADLRVLLRLGPRR